MSLFDDGLEDLDRHPTHAHHPAQVIHDGPFVLEDGEPLQRTGMLVLSDEHLEHARAAIAPLAAHLAHAFLVFSEAGLLVHASVRGEQVYVTLAPDQFSTFVWSGPQAVFLGNVDGSGGVLDALKVDRRRTVFNVTFEVYGAFPARLLTRRAYFADAGLLAAGPGSPSVACVYKHEFNDYCIMLPSRAPDVSLTLSRPQVAKLAAVAKGAAAGTTFALARGLDFSVSSSAGVVTFPARDHDGTAVLERASRRRQGVDAVGATEPFAMTLEAAHGLLTLLQRLRAGNAELTFNFFTTPRQAPLFSVTTCGPVRATTFFFCAPADPATVPAAPEGAAATVAAACGAGASTASPAAGDKRPAAPRMYTPIAKRPRTASGEGGHAYGDLF
uniref:DNA polymerase processivity factor n=1 Tax=Suid herpesvirus 1 TaxID=10345 RepID=A0A6B8FLD2_SUHV|nr:polymerase processivity subunit [Suid alphaherpesvirus 1]